MAGRSHFNEIDSDLLILNDRLMKYIKEGMDNAVDVAQNIADYCPGEDDLKQMTKSVMQDFIQLEHQVKQTVTALNHVKSLGDSETGPPPLDIYKEKLQWLQAHQKSDFKGHPRYTEMVEQLDNDDSLEEQLNSLRTRLAGATSDDEVAMTSVDINIRCPFTGQTMVKPVRNTVCNHTYDRDGIVAYINSRKAKAKCPVGGCNNTIPIKIENLEDHTDMKKYIKLLGKLKS